MSEPILTQADDVRYSVVEQDARKRLGLSYNQYHVADTIYHLSQCERGYCYMSIPTQADFHNLSVRTIKNIIDELIALGFIEKVMRGGQTVGWRTTQAWYGQVIVAGDRRKARYAKNAQSPKEGAKNAQSTAESASSGVQKVQGMGAKNAPNMNTNSNKDTPRDTPRGFGAYNLSMNRYIAGFVERTGHGPSEEQIQKYYEKLKRGE